jgi:tRNA-(ms[2]io[6]A)-hydroxylase
MLHLKSATSPRWLRQVDEHLPEILIDHAHCEKKAAGTAMNLLFAYVEDTELCRRMTEIVQEELEHFHLVLDELGKRGIRFRRIKPSSYGRKLNDLARKQEPGRAVDRLLVAALIEARSCERFSILRDHVRTRDAALADFYGSLFESEARHHATYVALATHFAPETAVLERLDQLAELEAEIIDTGEELPRMHS